MFYSYYIEDGNGFLEAHVTEKAATAHALRLSRTFADVFCVYRRPGVLVAAALCGVLLVPVAPAEEPRP